MRMLPSESKCKKTWFPTDVEKRGGKEKNCNQQTRSSLEYAKGRSSNRHARRTSSLCANVGAWKRKGNGEWENGSEETARGVSYSTSITVG